MAQEESRFRDKSKARYAEDIITVLMSKNRDDSSPIDLNAVEIFEQNYNFNGNPKFPSLLLSLKNRDYKQSKYRVILGTAQLNGIQARGIYLPYTSGKGIGLNFADLSSDYSRQDSSGNPFITVLDGSDFAKGGFKKAKFIKARLRGVYFKGAILVEADLTEADLSCLDNDRTGARLNEANLVGAILKRANLTNVRADGYAKFDRANLEGAVLIGANLEWASMRGANLRGADLRKANLANADLTNALLDGAKINSQTNLNNVRGYQQNPDRYDEGTQVIIMPPIEEPKPEASSENEGQKISEQPAASQTAGENSEADARKTKIIPLSVVQKLIQQRQAELLKQQEAQKKPLWSNGKVKSIARRLFGRENE